MKRDEILKQAISKWGATAQMEMGIEECSELIKAICKLKRAKNEQEIQYCEEEIMEEVADVEIICHQIGMMLNRDKIEEIKVRKLERLKSRLNQSKP